MAASVSQMDIIDFAYLVRGNLSMLCFGADVPDNWKRAVSDFALDIKRKGEATFQRILVQETGWPAYCISFLPLTRIPNDQLYDITMDLVTWQNGILHSGISGNQYLKEKGIAIREPVSMPKPPLLHVATVVNKCFPPVSRK